MISLQGSQIWIEEINDTWSTGILEYPFGRGINFQIEVDKIKPIIDNLVNENYSIFVEPKENWYREGNKLLGSLEFLVKDPDGYLLRFAEDLGIKNI